MVGQRTLNPFIYVRLVVPQLVKYRKIWPHVLLAILIGVFVFLNNPPDNKINPQISNVEVSSEKEKEIARVSRVIDGDTIEVQLNNKKETVRLIGIDAPETVDPRKTVECFGKEASDKTKEILNGKTVRLETDTTQGERDKYGRLLRYVFLDRINFNELMISEGFAHEYTYQNSPYKYMEEFKEVQKKAQVENKGLWNEATCKIP